MQRIAGFIIVQNLIISVFLFLGWFEWAFGYNQNEWKILFEKEWSIGFSILSAFMMLIAFTSLKNVKNKKELIVFIIFMMFLVFNAALIIWWNEMRIFVGFKLQILFYTISLGSNLCSVIYLIYLVWYKKQRQKTL